MGVIRTRRNSGEYRVNVLSQVKVKTCRNTGKYINPLSASPKKRQNTGEYHIHLLSTSISLTTTRQNSGEYHVNIFAVGLDLMNLIRLGLSDLMASTAPSRTIPTAPTVRLYLRSNKCMLRTWPTYYPYLPLPHISLLTHNQGN